MGRRSFGPCAVVGCHPPSVVFVSLEALRTPYCWGFYAGFLMWARSIVNSVFSPVFPSLKDGGAVEQKINAKLLIVTRSFWGPPPIQEPTHSHFIRTKDAHIVLII